MEQTTDATYVSSAFYQSSSESWGITPCHLALALKRGRQCQPSVKEDSFSKGVCWSVTVRGWNCVLTACHSWRFKKKKKLFDGTSKSVCKVRKSFILPSWNIGAETLGPRRTRSLDWVLWGTRREGDSSPPHMGLVMEELQSVMKSFNPGFLNQKYPYHLKT